MTVETLETTLSPMSELSASLRGCSEGVLLEDPFGLPVRVDPVKEFESEVGVGPSEPGDSIRARNAPSRSATNTSARFGWWREVDSGFEGDHERPRRGSASGTIRVWMLVITFEVAEGVRV
mgnify:CR=1 FL=1